MMKSKDRNKPCPCGSGYKMKKCCRGKIGGEITKHITENPPKYYDVFPKKYVQEVLSKVEQKIIDNGESKGMFYHITDKERYTGGIKQGGMCSGWSGGSKNFLYVVDTDDKRIWNGMSCYRTSQCSPQGKGNKPFVVLGIKKEIIEWYEFKVLNDDRMKNDVLNLNNISKKIGYQNEFPLPIEFFEVVYEGITNDEKFEEKDRWELVSEHKNIPIEDVKLNDGFWGLMSYDERKYKNSKNVINELKKKDSVIKNHKTKKSSLPFSVRDLQSFQEGLLEMGKRTGNNWTIKDLHQEIMDGYGMIEEKMRFTNE